MNLSDKLIELRKEKGWSQEDFAEKLDVSRQAVSRWENGTALPDAQNLLRISKLYHVTADYLLNEDHEREIDISTVKSVTEETEDLSRKKKYRYWIAAIGVILLILSAVLAIVGVLRGGKNSQAEQHSQLVLNSVKENEIAPTCTSEGSYDEVVYCTECDEEVLRTAQSIAKLAHTPSSRVVIENEVEATCTGEGSYDVVIYCAVCNGEFSRITQRTARIAHQFQNKKCIACGEDQPSEGLLYMSNGNGTCTVDAGDCTDPNVVIPAYSPSGEKVVQIRAYAFAGHKGVESVRIPETVTILGEGAFHSCSNLESVNLPSGITRIYSYTFAGCEKLKEVTIPAGVTEIGEEAFADCVAFESIVIPASVTKIGKFAFRSFSGCDGTVIFEIYNDWGVYDASGNLVKIIDFKNHVFQPVDYITFMYSDHVWKRNK